jgi:hypothetical protein
MSDNPGFLETLREQQITQGPDFDPAPPIEEKSIGEVSGNLAWQQSQEENAKANTHIEVASEDMLFAYRDSLVIKAMELANSIPGVEFESYEDWEAHVDKVVTKIKSNRS